MKGQSAQQDVQMRLKSLNKPTLYCLPHFRIVLSPSMNACRFQPHRLRPIFVSGNPSGEIGRLTHIYNAP